MGIFDKIKQAKADHDARKAAEAAELQALCDRLRQNEIFLNYAESLYQLLRDPSNELVQWASGKSQDQQGRSLDLMVTPNEFGLVRSYCFYTKYQDSDGKVRTTLNSTFEPVDIRSFADFGMQSLPGKTEIKTAVLETLASRLKEISYLAAAPGNITDTTGDRMVSMSGLRITVSGAALQNSRTAW